MRVLFDTNIRLDIALGRLPHFQASAAAFKLVDNRKIAGYVTATTITDMYYIARKEKGHSMAIEFIKGLLETIQVVGIDKDILTEALYTEVTDYEDSVQSVAASFSTLDCIITRNTGDFRNSKVEALTPGDFLKRITTLYRAK